MLNTNHAPWPSFGEEERAAVAEVLAAGRVNYWTGNEGRLFETEFANWVGSRHAIALANGTVALDLALRGLGIGSVNGGSASDEVVVTPRTFIASASTVINAGAIPVFADVDRDSGNITSETIEQVVSENTRAFIPVHLAGWPCEMDPIMALAKTVGAKVIEDCAQAHGAMYRGSSVGSIGDVGAWSFCQDKIMSTGGEGGMVTCDDHELWLDMWSFKDHGKSWNAVYERRHPEGFRWLHESFGTNWRLTEMQSAIGRIQLGRMTGWTAARRRNADRLAQAFAPFGGKNGAVRVPRLPVEDNSTRHAYYKFYAYVRPDGLRAGRNRDTILEALNARGVFAQQGSCSEIYREKAFGGAGLEPSRRLPIARELGETSLMFLVHPTLEDEDLQRICRVIGDVFDGVSR